MSIDLSLPPALFDLDEFELTEPTEPRPRWDTVPCHLCGHPLTRWTRMNQYGDWDGWYSHELMEPAWTHLREHWKSMRILAITYGPIRNGYRKEAA